MGRRKITIGQIVDPKLRHITFNKRKNGLIKKAAELSLLCNVNMLLIFEDGNGNLIQFSKNKLNSIPSFFQECHYNNVLEFTAKQYPTFFKINHYKKHKYQDGDAYGEDDEEIEESEDSKATNMVQGRTFKRGKPHIKEEDYNKEIYQSESEGSSNEDEDINQYTQVQASKKPQPTMKPNNPKGGEKQQKKMVQMNQAPMNEQEALIPQKDSFQNNQQMMGFEPFKGTTPSNEAENLPFRFYPTDNNNLPNPTVANNNFVNNSNFMNAHSYINNAYPNVNNMYSNNNLNSRMGNVGNINMANMNTMNNMRGMANEEALNTMFNAGFPQLGFGIGGANPFLNKQNNKPQNNEKLLDTANMIKYLNSTGGNGYPSQKMYNFASAEAGKPDEAETMSQFKNSREDFTMGNESGYQEVPPQYVRGFENNIPLNLPSAFFNSKKFNFEGYPNAYEGESFNEFSNGTKKKVKQNQ